MVKEITFYCPRDIAINQSDYEKWAWVNFKQLLELKWTKNITRKRYFNGEGKFKVKVEIDSLNSRKFDRKLKELYKHSCVVYTIKNFKGGITYENSIN